MILARGLPRPDAAEYLGISPSKFSCLVRDGRLPSPRMIDCKKVWDRKELDEFFEALPFDNAHDPNEWDNAGTYTTS
jgi:predicted DNA-binding transcriptional regulator AlpA